MTKLGTWHCLAMDPCTTHVKSDNQIMFLNSGSSAARRAAYFCGQQHWCVQKIWLVHSDDVLYVAPTTRNIDEYGSLWCELTAGSNTVYLVFLRLS